MPRATSRSKHVTLDVARIKLSYIWFIGAGVLFMVLTIQSLLGKYASDTQQVWAWFIPCVFPTLSLMISVLGAGALGPGDRRHLRHGFFMLTIGLSITYLCVLVATVVVASIRVPAINVLTLSNAFLGPLQGVVVGAISYIFISKHALETDPHSPPASSTRGQAPRLEPPAGAVPPSH